MAQEAKEVQAEAQAEKEALPPIKYGESDLSDVILVVEEQEFHVHKMVLAARSKYFKALFFGDFKEKNENRIEIKEVSRVAFRRLMDFIYCGTIKDEHATFVARVLLKNTDCGKYEINHKAIEDKEKHVTDFWKRSNEIWKVAERFDVENDFQKYFQNLLDHYICNTSSCFACVTMHIFGFSKGLFFDLGRFKKYDYKFIKEWFKTAETAKIDQNDEKLKFVGEFLKLLA